MFFTDINTDASKYCLLNINRYDFAAKYAKEIIFVDPGVYELTKNDEYSCVKRLHFLANDNLMDNEYISIDYPPDMNVEFSDVFVERSIRNNYKYIDNPQYICVIQSNFMDYFDLMARTKEIKEIWSRDDKIVGIGNFCRIIYPNRYTEHAMGYLAHVLPKGKWIHFYGLSMPLMRRYIPRFERKFKVSVDSTKWTRALTKEIKDQCGISCKLEDRDFFFKTYMERIKKHGLSVDF